MRSSLRAQMLVMKRVSPVESFCRLVTTLTLQLVAASTIRNSPGLSSSGWVYSMDVARLQY